MASSVWTILALKEHYDQVISDITKLEEERFKAINNRFELDAGYLEATLESQRILNDTVHEASTEAIKKAENAQNQYNVIHNDLVRKNELMQSKVDAEKDINNVVERIEQMRNHFEDKIDSRFKDLESKIVPIKTGSDIFSGKIAERDKSVFNAITIISIIFGIFGLISLVVNFFFTFFGKGG